ncbi:MAG TPA: hypothetical protein VFR97_01635 [Capillimicrobium sp.]|nr:hypothetical protein [Capillimicrobium sp.]
MTLRAAALLALAAFAVHEARYLLVPDRHADAGHGYLAAVPVVLALLLALAAGRALGSLGRRRAAGRGLTWAAASAALVGVHGVQEALERLVAGGGPVDAGLLLVVPLAVVAGALVAVALRRAERLLDEASAPARAPRPRGAFAVTPAAPTGGLVVAAPTGIARHLAGRAPPAFG